MWHICWRLWQIFKPIIVMLFGHDDDFCSRYNDRTNGEFMNWCSVILFVVDLFGMFYSSSASGVLNWIPKCPRGSRFFVVADKQLQISLLISFTFVLLFHKYDASVVEFQAGIKVRVCQTRSRNLGSALKFQLVLSFIFIWSKCFSICADTLIPGYSNRHDWCMTLTKTQSWFSLLRHNGRRGVTLHALFHCFTLTSFPPPAPLTSERTPGLFYWPTLGKNA